MTATEHQATAGPESGPATGATMSSQWLPWLIGVAGTMLAAAGSWVPSFWYDEAATVSAINRPVPEIFSLLRHVDGVHAAHYLVLHGWSEVFGYSEFALRFPSSVAVGAAAGCMVTVGRRLGGPSLGILSAVALLSLPRVMWAGSEARSYAGTLFLAILFTLVLLVACERGGAWWVAYVAIGVVSVIWFAFAFTLVIAHVAIVVVRGRRIPRELGIATAAITLICLPFLLWVFGQRSQVNWIPHLGAAALGRAMRYEYANGSLVYLAVSGLVLVTGFTAAFTAGAVGGWRTALAGLTWCLVPAVLVLGYSWVISPVYTPRYLIFTDPAMALILAWAVLQLGRGRLWLTVVPVLGLIGAAIPDYVAQREPYGRTGGTDFSQVADYIHSRARPGDCVAFELYTSWTPTSERIILRAKPDDFRGLRDIGPQPDAAQIGHLWDGDKAVSNYRSFGQTCQTMWVATDGERRTATVTLPGGAVPWYFQPFRFTGTQLYDELAASGLQIRSRVQFNHSQVVQMIRRAT